MAKHARLSASGSKQWINCPGSIAREGALDVGSSSTMFGMQGTAGHALADYCLTTGSDPDDHVDTHLWVYDGSDQTKKDVVAVPPKGRGGKLEERLADEGYVCFTVVDGEGNGEITEVKTWAVAMFVNLVRRDYEKTIDVLTVLGATEAELPKLTTEQYMDGSWLHPLMGGTADANFRSFENRIRLYDLKFGAGVSVEVEDNTQLRIYSVLIMHLHDWEPDGVDMAICQPRLEHPDGPIRWAHYSREELMSFRDELRALADETQKPNAPIRPGDWCLWCKAKPFCDEFKQHTQELAAMDFNDDPGPIPAPVDLASLERLARWMPMLDALNKEVEGAIGRLLHRGHKLEDWKLVRKKTNRRFGRPRDDDELGHTAGDEVPEEELVALLKSEGLLSDADIYIPRKLKTLAQLERLGKDAKEAIKKVTYKPEGALTVAPRSDPRAEVEVDVTGGFPDEGMEIPG